MKVEESHKTRLPDSKTTKLGEKREKTNERTQRSELHKRQTESVFVVVCPSRSSFVSVTFTVVREETIGPVLQSGPHSHRHTKLNTNIWRSNNGELALFKVCFQIQCWFCQMKQQHFMFYFHLQNTSKMVENVKWNTITSHCLDN